MIDDAESDNLYSQLLDRAGGSVELVARTAVDQLVKAHTALTIAEKLLFLTIRKSELMLKQNGSKASDLVPRLSIADWQDTAKIQAIANLLCPETPASRRRGRPVTKKWQGLYVPQKYRSKNGKIGALQKYPLPYATKVHALSAFERELQRSLNSGEKFNARFAAFQELVSNGIHSTRPDFNDTLNALHGAVRKAKMASRS